MGVSRRDLLRKGAGTAIAAGAAGVLASHVPALADKCKKAVPGIGACGLACGTCPLMAAGKCKGCGPANAMSLAMVKKKKCPVLTCANRKKIAHCGTACKGFATCKKLVGRPYSKAFLDKIGSKLKT